jgi:hypothetical protein
MIGRNTGRSCMGIGAILGWRDRKRESRHLAYRRGKIAPCDPEAPEVAAALHLRHSMGMFCELGNSQFSRSHNLPRDQLWCGMQPQRIERRRY